MHARPAALSFLSHLLSLSPQDRRGEEGLDPGGGDVSHTSSASSLVLPVCFVSTMTSSAFQAIQATIQRHEQTVESFRQLTCSLRDEESTPPHSPVTDAASPRRRPAPLTPAGLSAFN